MRLAFATIFLLLGVPSIAQVGSNDGSGVARSRVIQLRHGVNTSGWFAGVYTPERYDAKHFESWITVQDLQLIRAWGFDFVRFGVNPEPMFKRNQPDQIPQDYLNYLRAAVREILDSGLAVVIVLQPESDFKGKVTTDDGLVEQLSDFWRALAHYFSQTDPERIFFEILNEPELTDSYRWQGIQAKLAAAIREGAPQNTILAVGGHWSSLEGLISLEPLRDRNVIYSFHYYEPYLFTHQGATWGSYSWHSVKGLRYPSNPDQAAKTASNVPNPADRLTIVRYGYESWSPDRIRSEIAQAEAWAQVKRVPVICDEFGVYRMGASSEDRAAWVADVRAALESDGIGWAIWDYSGNFGLVAKQDGKVIVDTAMLCALGTKSPCVSQ